MREVELKRKDGTKDTYTAFTAHEFPYDLLKDEVVSRNKRQYVYITTYGTYDIETTTVDDEFRPYAFMYHWQMCVGGYLAYGRDWTSLHLFLNTLIEKLNINNNRRFVIYVHNLGMEYEFSVNFFQKWFGTFEILATHKREPIRWMFRNGLEFRCSYILSNMNLEIATKKEFGVTHIKASGDLDYRKFRTPATWLDDVEFGYCMNDVLSLYEFVSCRMKNEGDNMSTIPLTSTGYVRRDYRNATRKEKFYYQDVFKKTRLWTPVYILFKEACRGGNTHPCIYRTGTTQYDVLPFDGLSQYPFTVMLNRFPISAFEYYGEIDDEQELDMLCKKYCCIFRVTLENVKLKKGQPIPYLDSAHCRGLPKNSNKDYLFDNGRVLEAKYLDLTVTEIDWNLIKQQYEFKDEYHVRDVYIADRGFLPQSIRDKILSYFGDKCKLKYDLQH